MNTTLLVAEEPSPSRDALRQFLSGCGFDVVTADDGLDCLARLRELEPELLVADWELPWGGAAAVVAYLNQSHFEFVMPVVLVIGDAPASLLSQRTGVPRSSCFPKPVPKERLLDQVGLAVALIDLRNNTESASNLGATRLQEEPAVDLVS